MFIRTKSWFNASCPATNLQLKRTQTRLPARNGEGAVKLQTTKPKSVPQQNPLPQTYSIQFWAHHTVGPQEGASIFTLLVSCQFPWSLIFKILFCYVQHLIQEELREQFHLFKKKKNKETRCCPADPSAHLVTRNPTAPEGTFRKLVPSVRGCCISIAPIMVQNTQKMILVRTC